MDLDLSHRRRLREIWRSAGWPCQDAVEAELLAAGLVERLRDGAGRDTLRVTDAGVQVLVQTRAAHRARQDAHEALVARVAGEMQRAGRVVWCGLSLRARVGERWAVARPDVFSIRHTTVPGWVEPTVHEVKVRRADLLADLRRPHKGAAYRELSSRCFYVLAPGIAEPDEIPAPFGVLIAHDSHLELARAAPARAFEMPFPLWMALARSTPQPGAEESPQLWLGDPGEGQSAPSP